VRASPEVMLDAGTDLTVLDAVTGKTVLVPAEP
jgi:hypothetical protein